MPSKWKSPSRTEYRTAFRPGGSCVFTNYLNNVDYRLQRRQNELEHHTGVFYWGDSDSENSDDGEYLCSKKSTKGIPRHVYKHQKYNKAHKEKSLTCQKQEDEKLRKKNCATTDGSTTELNGGPSYTSVQEEREPRPKVPAATNQSNRNVEKWAKRRTPVTTVTRQRSPPKYKTPSPPQARPFSAPTGRPVYKSPPRTSGSSPSDNDDRPPFLPYGFYDDAKLNGVKKTHNVRASRDVYPAALRAMKRREVDIESRERDYKTSPYRDINQLERAYFNDRVKRETSHWSSEYQNQFAGFDRDEYRRALSARMCTPTRDYYQGTPYH